MADLSAAYALNTSDNFFGDGDGYVSTRGVEITPAPNLAPVASTAPKVGFDVHHHFACIVVIGVLILFATDRVGFRGVVTT